MTENYFTGPITSSDDITANNRIIGRTGVISSVDVVADRDVIAKRNLVTKGNVDADRGVVVTKDVIIESSQELKQDIISLSKEEAYSLIEDLEPVKFAFKDDPTKKENIGFIAENVPDILSDESHKRVRYLEIISALTKIVKDLKNEVNELKGKPNNSK